MGAVLIMVAAGFAAGTDAVVWHEAAPGSSLTVEVEKEANYNVWLWGPVASGAAAKVDGKEVKAEAGDGRRVQHVWLRAGSIDLTAGEARVALGDDAAGIALAESPRFDPNAAASLMRVHDGPHPVRDGRATLVRDTDTVFTMPRFDSRAEWEAYAEKLRRRVLLSSGLLPLPEKTPLNPVISGRIEREDYTIENVRFEARPGFLVTGNLYRPKGSGPFPAIVAPHGHWQEGRFANDERGSVPARCITLARMGCVVFSYDMIGYVDSLQYKHGWGGAREDLWAHHPFAAQLWWAIRAVDFLESLPDVDAERIGCTGASGGGTQTFALSAVDGRVLVSAPVNMVSSTMQGGCGCENAPILRLDASNMEITALAAPRPLLMVAATGDWTRETPRVEFPAVRSIYEIYGAENLVETVLFDAGHNYNKDSREAVYRFFGAHLLGQPDKYADFTEPEFQMEPEEALRVFPDGKLPEGLPTAEEITASVIESNRAKWEGLMPAAPAALANFKTEYGDVLGLVTGASVPEPNDFAAERTGYQQRETFVVERWILRRKGKADAVPAVLYRGLNDGPPQDAVVLVYDEGKRLAVDAARGAPGPVVSDLLDQGKAVLAIDAFLTGEHHPVSGETQRAFGRYPDTFLPTDTGYRIQDVITAAAWLRARRDMTGKVGVAGFGDGGVWAMFAAAIDAGISSVAIDADGFNPDDDAEWAARFYIPCIRSVGDVATAAAMIAPRPLLIMNASPGFEKRVEAYKAGGSSAVFAHGEGIHDSLIRHFEERNQPR